MIALPAVSSHADAFGKKVGLGLELGSPSGISGKFFISGDHAIDALLGFGFFGGQSLHLHADYLYHFGLLDNDNLRMEFYPGVGPYFKFRDSDQAGDPLRIGLRFPLGLVFLIHKWAENKAPIDLFIEVAPGVRLSDKTSFSLDGGVGARYYF